MSHFAQVKTQIRNKECLVAALTELSLKPTVHEEPVHLKGYYGDSQGYLAEIVVPGKCIHARSDIGFRLNDDQTYSSIYDSYETDPRLGSDFFSHKLVQAYGRQVVLAKIEQLKETHGECTIEESTHGTNTIMRLTFPVHQQHVQHARR